MASSIPSYAVGASESIRSRSSPSHRLDETATSAPCPAALGEGETDVSTSVHLQGLSPSTTYHYRVVATNAVTNAGGTQGADQAFTTQTASGELVLPDGRQWELVSPPNKYGALLDPFFTGVIEASEDGSAVTYLANAPIEPSPEGNSGPAPNQVLARRGDTSAWLSKDIATPSNSPLLTVDAEYKFFSGDLAHAVLEPLDEAPLAPGASGTMLYLRDNTAGTYQPIAKSSVAAGATRGYTLVGTPPDLRHVVYTVGTSAGENLYEWSGGHAELVSVVPEGTPALGETPDFRLGWDDRVVRHAVSDDGSRVIFSVTTNGIGGSDLFVRDVATGETVRANPGLRYGHFQTASNDGTKVFFTNGEPFGELFEFDVEGGKLTDLTPGANMLGMVIGASEDGSYVYFVSDGVLASGAKPGSCENEKAHLPLGALTCNLYVAHDDGTGWKTTLITTLSGADLPSWGENSNGESARLSELTSRVSPDGRYLAFMSERSLTGYDNRDLNSGVPDEEVYLYDASSGRLVCASCNPTGARPIGLFDIRRNQGPQSGPLVDRLNVWENRWLAGSIPGFRPQGPAEVASYQPQPRYLSDSGRLFFDSSDALVPHDTNGKEDVYQYEPAGVGGCTTSQPTFSERSGGCADLISSGRSGEESVFLDASVSGKDVFFLTGARLVPQDVDTAFDVYDAHVCTTQMPCASPPVLPPACSTADSCKPAPSQQPGVFGAPASATFSGSGNLAPPATMTVPGKAKKKTVQCRRGRKIGHGKCAKKKRSKKAAAKRSSDNRRAGR